MRLTLRTLLAYLDDTLEPAAAKEIGQKLAETPAAQELVARIREVTRRRRLTAPPVAGDDVDPNQLAEYLDNLLPPESVSEIERICLESDVHLAESAACHQILTLIGQPAHVTPTTRQRMYDLVHAIESLPADQRPASRPRPQPMPAPSLFAQRPLLARVLSIGAAVLGVILIVVLVHISLNVKGPDQHTAKVDSDPDGIFRPTDLPPEGEIPALPKLPETDPSAAKAPVLPDETMPVEPGDDRPRTDAQRKEGSEPDESRPVPAAPADAAGDNASKPPKADAGPDEPSAPEPAKAEPVSKSQPADPAMEKPEKEKPTEPEPPPANPIATYASTFGVLMRADATAQDWRRVSPRAEIRPQEVLLNLPSYRAAFQFDNGTSIEVSGETELVLLGAETDGQTHLQLDRGQLVLGTNKEGASFRIDFLGESWQVTMSSPETVVGLSLMPTWRPGATGVYEAVLYVPRGEIDFQTTRHSHKLGGPVQIRWSSTAGLGERQALSLPPAWLDREPMTPLEVRASESLEASLRMDSSVALPLIEAIGSDRKELRLLAVRGLGAIGRLAALIDAMNTLDRREVRQEAIKTLRQFMSRSIEHEKVLADALLAKFQDADRANGVLALLKGFSDTELKQREVYESLINLLSRSHDLGVRELAITNLEEMAGKLPSVSYSPDKPNDAAISAWRRMLDDNRLPPRERGKL